MRRVSLCGRAQPSPKAGEHSRALIRAAIFPIVSCSVKHKATVEVCMGLGSGATSGSMVLKFAKYELQRAKQIARACRV